MNLCNMSLSGTVHTSLQCPHTNRLLRLSQGSSLYYYLLLKGYLEPKKIMAITFALMCIRIYIHKYMCIYMCVYIYAERGNM